MGKRLNILVLGGRGFLGKAVCIELKEHIVFTFDRNLGNNKHMQGSIENLNDLKKTFSNINCVVNLVGLTPVREPKNTSYYNVHVIGVKNIIEACKLNNVNKLIHVSALGADKNSKIEYIKTKGLAEELVLDSGLNINVICPSVVYDKDSELIKIIDKLAFTRMFPDFKSKVQPVYRGDLARLIRLAVEGKVKEEKIEVGGLDKMTMFNMAEKIYEKKGYSCRKIPIQLVLSLMGLVKLFKLFGITDNQIKIINLDNVTDSKTAEKYVKLIRFDDWINKTSFN